MDNEIKKGDQVKVIVEVWKEDETPTEKNFYQAQVLEVVRRAKHSFYLRLQGLDRLIPMDRARAV